MSYAIFDDAGNCVAMSATERDGYESVEFGMGLDIIKVDGDVRLMTNDEISARETARQNAAAAADNRHTRDGLLADSDWVVTKALESGGSVPADWATYRTALRDLTDHSDWPNLADDDWPTKPSS